MPRNVPNYLRFDAEDSRHLYKWTQIVRGGTWLLAVTQRRGEWRGYYRLDTCPAKLVLTGFSHGNPPAELYVDFVTMGDIERMNPNERDSVQALVR